MSQRTRLRTKRRKARRRTREAQDSAWWKRFCGSPSESGYGAFASFMREVRDHDPIGWKRAYAGKQEAP